MLLLNIASGHCHFFCARGEAQSTSVAPARKIGCRGRRVGQRTCCTTACEQSHEWFVVRGEQCAASTTFSCDERHWWEHAGRRPGASRRILLPKAFACTVACERLFVQRDGSCHALSPNFSASGLLPRTKKNLDKKRECKLCSPAAAALAVRQHACRQSGAEALEHLIKHH